jgi:nicotinamide-nucleotide amidase
MWTPQLIWTPEYNKLENSDTSAKGTFQREVLTRDRICDSCVTLCVNLLDSHYWMRIIRRHMMSGDIPMEKGLAQVEAVARLAGMLTEQKLTLVTAESCTGGLLAACLTDVPGSSEWFEGAFVTYRLRAKTDLLAVDSTIWERWGAVSEPTAKAMATGALTHSSADVSVAITGVAGPGGGELFAPTGTVWFAWARRHDSLVHTASEQFSGDRQAVRRGAVLKAVCGLQQLLGDELSNTTIE